MRLSVTMLAVSFAGMVVGGWLIAPWALGLAVVLDSFALGVFALLRDVPAPAERRLRLSRVSRSDRPGERAA